MKTISHLIEKLSNKYKRLTERSKDIVNNIGLTFVMKASCIVASLLIVPLSINYVSPEQYGIWITLSSIIGWVSFFDLGLSNGFRNRFAEAKAKGDIFLCRQLLSTSYFAIGCIISVILLIILCINNYLNWSSILNVDVSISHELKVTFAVVISFTCMQIILNVFNSLLMGNQQPGLCSVITAIGQYTSLFVIKLLAKYTEGSLMNLALFYAGVPCFVLFLASIYMFSFTKYKKYRPSIKLIKSSLIKDLLSIGSQFFLIYICLIFVYHIINIAISREIGAYAVTQYSIVNKYYGMVYMVITIISTPFWSAFTDAFAKNDYEWMTSMVKKLNFGWYLSIGFCIILLAISPVFFRIWLGDSVEIPISLSIAMVLLISSQNLGAIYMNLVNGIGTVRLQLIIYLIFALISWPLYVFSCRYLGIVGATIIPVSINLTLGLVGRAQVHKILDKSATGIWIK